MNKKLEEIFTCNKSTHGETGHCWNGRYSHNQKCGCCDENVASLLHKAFAAGQETKKGSRAYHEGKSDAWDRIFYCKKHKTNNREIYLPCCSGTVEEIKQKGRQEVFDSLDELFNDDEAYRDIKEKFVVK